MFKRFVKTSLRYWGLSIPGLIFSFLFVAMNATSLWVVASLIQSVFDPAAAQAIPIDTGSVNGYLKFITRSMISGLSPIGALNRLAIIILVVFTLKNIFFYLKGIIFARISLLVINDLRNQLYSHITRQSMSYFDRSSRGEFISVIMNDVMNYHQAIMIFFSKLFIEPLNVIFIVGLLFVISWKFTLWVMIIFPIFTVIFINVGGSIRRKGRRSFDQIGRITTFLHQMLGGIRLIKSFDKVNHEIDNFKKKNRLFFKLQYRQKILQTVSSPISEMIGVLAGVLLFAIGGRMVFGEHGIDSEDFLRYMVLLFSSFQPIKQLTDVNSIIQNGLASAERIYEVLDQPTESYENAGAIEKNVFDSDIEFRDVSFRYETQWVLNNINFRLHRGHSLALVGSSGSGKSTIADLLIRFYAPQQGQILIDGMDICDIRESSLINMMGIVSQDVILFNDTITANIAYGFPDASIEDIENAARTANALEFIANLENGWDTIVGDQGVKLSGGQKQRISIARAILKNPPILILDEATSSLDTESERLVQESLNRLMEGRTSLIIAHRLSTVMDADEIFVLDKGRIVCRGAHQSLLTDCEIYKMLYHQQAKGHGETS